MNLRDFIGAYAAYNRWVNEQLYDAAAALSDDQRRRELGGAFGSVHGTLQHLIVGDRMWLQRFRGQPLTGRTDQARRASFEELRAWRVDTDDDIDRWAAGVDPELTDRPFHFKSLVYNRERTVPHWAAVVHMFNHQTHHRGQVMTMLRQLGRGPGLIADFVWMPHFE